MCASQVQITDVAQGRDSLSLQAVSKEPWRCIRHLWGCATQGLMYRHGR